MELIPLVSLRNKVYTIDEIASLVIDFYSNLRIDNEFFETINFVSENIKNNIDINLKDINCKDILADEILYQNRKDIKIFEKRKEFSTSDSVLKAPISFSLEIKKNGSNFSTLYFCFSSSKHLKSRIGIIKLNQDSFRCKSNMISFLTCCNSSFDVLQSTIKLSDEQLNERNRRYNYHLGFINYFSNDFVPSIPNDLEGVEYEFTEKGKFISVVCEDEFKESDVDIYKEKLLKVMEQIEGRFPEYLK